MSDQIKATGIQESSRQGGSKTTSEVHLAQREQPPMAFSLRWLAYCAALTAASIT